MFYLYLGLISAKKESLVRGDAYGKVYSPPKMFLHYGLFFEGYSNQNK